MQARPSAAVAVPTGLRIDGARLRSRLKQLGSNSGGLARPTRAASAASRCQSEIARHVIHSSRGQWTSVATCTLTQSVIYSRAGYPCATTCCRHDRQSHRHTTDGRKRRHSWRIAGLEALRTLAESRCSGPSGRSKSISGASDDQVYPARVAFTTMIFVRCKNGAGPNKIGDARMDHLATDCKVLLRVMLNAASKVERTR